MEDEKEDLSDRTTFVSVDSRKNSAGSYRNNDEMDRAAVCAGQTPDGVSFLLSRLPDQEKLDSILEHQVCEGFSQVCKLFGIFVQSHIQCVTDFNQLLLFEIIILKSPLATF